MFSTDEHEINRWHFQQNNSNDWLNLSGLITVVPCTRVNLLKLYSCWLRTFLVSKILTQTQPVNLSINFGELTVPKASKDLTTSVDQTNTTDQTVIPSDPELYQRAINEGREQLVQQRSKAAAARTIYQLLQNESRDVLLNAFIEGADITPKGSPTYYYNITRKLKRQNKSKTNH